MYQVLVAEDEKIIREGIKKTIEHISREFKVMWEAANGKRAIECLQTAKPDVLITDIRMPLKDGLEVIKNARRMYADINIVIISGYDEFEYAQTAMKEGVKHYLLKPIRPSELSVTLEKIYVELKREDKSDVSLSDDHEKIRKIKNLIVEHIHENLSLQELGDIVNLHPNYISTFFKQQTGMKISDFTIEERMKRAKELLSCSEMKIYEIAYAVGYKDEKHFMSVFKKQEMMPPTKFRNMRK